MPGYDDHVRWALSTAVEGFDFTPVAGRVIDGPLPWDYRALARRAVAEATGPVLDLGTGGGEFLAGLGPFPPGSAATEGWPPNVHLARATLAPHGVRLHALPPEHATRLPLPDATFAVVLDRHEDYDPAEVARVLAPGGVFLTQQVGSTDGTRLNGALGGPGPDVPEGVALAPFAAGLTRAGLNVERAEEHEQGRTFTDIGAVIWYLRMVAWQIPDFDVARYDAPLRGLHAAFERGEQFRDVAPRFVLAARRPAR
ncbi:class I SAM-dependent methyltransferase [Occultella glacieicola]|uniref:Class I SAM-dependent methyltransferase n=1 Tax=Occultella glacieicola TaxID=2518684 RepID=A0ABY2DXT2_9MICO|nr:class I SAM-dependent methyltransferase [Occultella glacieicola]TDE88942.1 class I SAM-dependent methyltransferase [Occultella glacieicola]